jgi:predicted RNA binding protein YcfA (HicA-like mRNA interferase family)
MKLPRDVDGPRLVKALSALGYAATRQTGSHVRVTTQRDGENHEVIPLSSLRSRQGRSPASSSESLLIMGWLSTTF